MLTQIGLLLLASCSAPAPEAPIGDGPRASSDSTVVEVPATPSASSGELPTSSTSGPTSPGPGASSAPTGIASTAPTIPPVPPGPAVSVTRSAQKLELSAPIVFEVGGPHLKPESEAVVEAIASFMPRPSPPTRGVTCDQRNLEHRPSPSASSRDRRTLGWTPPSTATNGRSTSAPSATFRTLRTGVPLQSESQVERPARPDVAL